jgi:hypothetical protein
MTKSEPCHRLILSIPRVYLDAPRWLRLSQRLQWCPTVMAIWTLQVRKRLQKKLTLVNFAAEIDSKHSRGMLAPGDIASHCHVARQCIYREVNMFTRGKAMAALCAVGCLLGELLIFGHAEAATRRSGVIKEFDGVDEIVQACKAATTFVNVPKMTTTFTISGSPSPVVVTFSGSASLSGQQFDTGFVRLLIDGVEQTPGEVPFVSEGELSEAHAFTWQTKSLSVGSHTASLQWRTDLGSSFCLDARSLIVLHR